jgi:peptidoglycan/LPS O-acetylase OafA/YrhL
LVPFYALALALISLAVAMSRHVIQASWLPNEPTIWQFVAHGLLLHDLLGFEALSSGAWYVAIDFQLYALLVLLCHILHSRQRVSLAVAMLCIASMWQFNRVDELEIWAIYFFAAYGLGVLAAWAKRSTFDTRVFWLTALLAIGALWFEYRTRLCLALVTAIWLVVKPKGSVHWTPMKRVLHRFSNSAYVLFLTHFGVIVLFSHMWNQSHFYHPVTAFALTGFAWLFCVGLGLFLHEKAEVAIHHWLTQKTKPFFARLNRSPY